MSKSGQKTYWHLLSQGRVPTEYEIVSSKLNYYPSTGFEVEFPVLEWYRKYQEASPFQCSAWEQFKDPRLTTYASYTKMQSEQETYIDGVLDLIDQGNYDKELTRDWIDRWERIFPPLLFMWHGFQMVIAYVGKLAAESKVTLVCSFQAADEMRRIQRVAYRIRQLQEVRPKFGEARRGTWEQDPLWQGVRKVTEEMLVAYDFGEAFVALNLSVKPIFDEFFVGACGELAHAQGDYLFHQILQSLKKDCDWQRAWSLALLKVVLSHNADVKSHCTTWATTWTKKSKAALEPFYKWFAESGINSAALQQRMNDFEKNLLTT